MSRKRRPSVDNGLASFENPLGEQAESGLAMFDAGDDGRSASPERHVKTMPSQDDPQAQYPETPPAAGGPRTHKAAAKKKAGPECQQFLWQNSGDSLQTDFFELFSAALTTLTQDWDPAADLFKTMDDGGDGELGRAEVRIALKERLSEKQIKEAFLEMDADGGGSIDIAEFRDWWDKRVISTSGSFHSVLGQMSREQSKQEMKKSFETSDLPKGELSTFISLGGKFDAEMDAEDFFGSIDMHLGIQLSKAERRQLAEELFAERPRKAGGETDRTEMYTVREFVSWWEEFFEFDPIDPYAQAMKVLEEEKRLINPFAKFRGDWDMIQLVMLFYIMTSVPYRLGFDDEVELWSLWFWVDVLIDIYFIADVLVNFRTAVIRQDGKVMFKQKDIAWEYGRTWLIVDVISCLPLGYIAYWNGESATSEHRTLKLLRLLRLLRLARIKRILDRWEEMLYGMQWFKMVKVIVVLGGCAHWMACVWYFFGLVDPLNDEQDGVEPLAGAYESRGWVHTKYENYTEVPISQRYFDSFFWGMSTSLMVSSSDDPMSPTTLEEKSVFLIAFFVGALLFSFIIGTVSDIIAHSNPGATARNDAIGVVNSFLAERGVKAALLRRSRAHVKDLYEQRGTHLNISEVLSLLPFSVQLELGAALHFLDDPETSRRSAFARVPFFKDLGNSEMLAIGCCLKHVRHVPIMVVGTDERSKDSNERAINGTYIMQEGDRGVEMWIIVEGVVSVKRRVNGVTEDLGKLREGDYFGEMAVLCQERPGVPLRRGRSASAVTSLLLYTMCYDDLVELRKAHPQIDAAVHETCDALRKTQPSLFVPDNRVQAARIGACFSPGLFSFATDVHCS